MPTARHHLGFANLASALALAVSLGGTGAYAAQELAPNSVGSAQLKNNAVTGAKVKNRSLKAVDFARGQLPRGARGRTGARGPAGAAGKPAYTAFAAVEDVDSSTPAVLGYGSHAVGVTDPAGDNGLVNPYVVTFDRDLTGCVASANSAIGEPHTQTGRLYGELALSVVVSGATVGVSAYGGGVTDTSFFVTVFC